MLFFLRMGIGGEGCNGERGEGSSMITFRFGLLSLPTRVCQYFLEPFFKSWSVVKILDHILG